jgi:hypothetical protein
MQCKQKRSTINTPLLIMLALTSILITKSLMRYIFTQTILLLQQMQSFSKMPIEMGAALGNGYSNGNGSGTGNNNGSPNGSRSPQSVCSNMKPGQGRAGKFLQGDSP